MLFWQGKIFVTLKKKEVLAYDSSVTRLLWRIFFAYKFSVDLFDSTIFAKTKLFLGCKGRW
uniref:Uncharacterized protein n=1 Tax=Brassica oleracea TaxID=3712 RepID=A0A3P6EFK1_BRAOL|nr:unnamed protein product [Brassica oleracea]